MQAPPSIRVRRAFRQLEPGTGVEHLHPQYTVTQSDAHLQVAVLEHVLDGVGDQLGEQEAGVLVHARIDVRADALEKQARLRR